MKNIKSNLLVCCVVSVFLSPFLLTSVSYSSDLKISDVRGKTNKVSVTVMQNRYFTKKFRPEFGLALGTVLDEAYLSTVIYGTRLSIFMNEWVGFEAQFFKTKVSDSEDLQALSKLKYRPLNKDEGTSSSGKDVFVSPQPEKNAVHQIIDLNAVAAPFYGKLNFIDKLIIYTDLYFIFGVSSLKTDQGSKIGMQIGGGERFYIGSNWSVRLDIRDRIFKETRAKQDFVHHAISIDLGLSYFFGSRK